ncbi:MAG: hypothetical protein IIA49_08990, partial [Bacteroidetes bacterium]|nr:hypothetical protein [Bacteroidota bacterium]
MAAETESPYYFWELRRRFAAALDMKDLMPTTIRQKIDKASEDDIDCLEYIYALPSLVSRRYVPGYRSSAMPIKEAYE